MPTRRPARRRAGRWSGRRLVPPRKCTFTRPPRGGRLTLGISEAPGRRLASRSTLALKRALVDGPLRREHAFRASGAYGRTAEDYRGTRKARPPLMNHTAGWPADTWDLVASSGQSWSCSTGAYEIPTIAPSGDCSLATV